MAVSRRLRYEILRRDNHQCRYCGATAPDAKLTVDHVLPVALGGTDEASNLVAACAACNGGKSASSPDATVVDDAKEGALRWAACLRRAAEERDHEAETNVAILNWFRSKWTIWFSFPSCYASGDECPQDQRTPMTLDDSWGWKRTLARWNASAAVDPKFIEEAIGIAMRKPGLNAEATWRYFCGVVWNEIKERQKLAAKYMVEEPAPAPAVAEQVDDQLPYGSGVAQGFDALNLAESYIAEIVEAVDAPDGVLKWATNGFWDAMQAGYTAFCRFNASDEEDGEASANERAAEAFDRAAVQSIAEIAILCHKGATL